MIMRLLISACSLAVATTAAPAQPVESAEAEIRPAEDVLQTMPKELLGARASRMRGSPMIMYMGADPRKDPTVAVMATLTDRRISRDELRADARSPYAKGELRSTLREGSFSTPLFPEATTYFAEYSTSRGHRQVWQLDTEGRRLTVSAFSFSGKLPKSVEAQIAEKIFGGATLTVAKPRD